MLKRILIIAGGTGGHIFPALAVAETLQQRGVEIHWLGTAVGLENKIISGKFPLHQISMGRVRGKGLLNWLLMPLRLTKAVFESISILKKIHPDVVLAMGGFASGPSGLAAWLKGYQLIIHEQNSKPGYANRLLAKIADQILTGFPQVFTSKARARFVGNPIRQTIIEAAELTNNNHFDQQKPLRLLVLGGSQGAQTLNELLISFIQTFPHIKRLFIHHQTGDKDFTVVEQAYKKSGLNARVEKFVTDMAAAYAQADLVISRAGALTVGEIAASGKPSILIPFPYAADNHQYYNGIYLQEMGASYVFEQKVMTPEKLVELINYFLTHPEQLIAMGQYAKKAATPNAAEIVADICESSAQRKRDVKNIKSTEH